MTMIWGLFLLDVKPGVGLMGESTIFFKKRNIKRRMYRLRSQLGGKKACKNIHCT
jgi:hypothetical protein